MCQIIWSTVEILYGHLNRIPSYLQTTNPPLKVKQGQIIGTIGKTGNACGANIIPHLHVQAKDASGNLLDIRDYMNTKFTTQLVNGQNVLLPQPCT